MPDIDRPRLVHICLALLCAVVALACSRSGFERLPGHHERWGDGTLDALTIRDGGTLDVDLGDGALPVHDSVAPTPDMTQVPCPQCGLGCSVDGACRRMVPSNVERRVDMNLGQVDLVVEAPHLTHWIFDTDTGTITALGFADRDNPSRQTIRAAGVGDDPSGIRFTPLAQRGTEVGLGVFSLGSLKVNAGAWLIGIGSRALVVLAQRDIVVEGLITVGADRVSPGPHPGAGGFRGASFIRLPGEGPGRGARAPARYGGGGGGSHAGAGGPGGLNGGTAGMPYGNEGLGALVGGSGGGGGYDTGTGGHGGGALQLSAGGRIEIKTTGQVDARGGGGRGGANGGGGGGSGGAILLEAPEVVVLGFVGANGGAGAGIGTDQHGAPGEPHKAPALTPDGLGGAGSDATGNAGSGSASAGNRGAGGGGGGGWIRINTTAGTAGARDGRLLPDFASGYVTVGKLHSLSPREPCQRGISRCVAGGLESCPGGLPSFDTCKLACGGEPHRCLPMRPSNLANAEALLAGSAEHVVGQQGPAHWVINTDDGAINAYPSQQYVSSQAASIRGAGVGDIGGIIFTTAAQGVDEPELALFSLRSLTVPEGTSVIAIGARPLAVLAADRIEVYGLVSVGADWLPDSPQPGAGGYKGGQTDHVKGYGPGGADPGRGGLAGNGGGFGRKGGEGDNFGGNPYGNTSLVPLWGGSGGGASGRGGTCANLGGNGGGALHLAAATRIVIGSRGVVDARGGGGRGGVEGCTGGAGGGTGGGLLIEAPEVELLGYLSANGGAGGRGHNPGSPVAHGDAGLFDRAPVPGPAELGLGAGGGHGSDAWGYTSRTDRWGSGEGGAGGSCGRIRVNSALTSPSFGTASVLPLPASGLATLGRVSVAR